MALKKIILLLFSGTETRLTESLSLIDAVTPDIVAARQNAQNAQKQAIKTDPGSGGEQNGVDVSIIVLINFLIL